MGVVDLAVCPFFLISASCSLAIALSLSLDVAMKHREISNDVRVAHRKKGFQIDVGFLNSVFPLLGFVD